MLGKLWGSKAANFTSLRQVLNQVWPLDETCKMCEEEKEMLEHHFFHCENAKLLWKLAPVQWDGLLQHTNSFKEWWRSIEAAATREEMEDRKELTAYILWHIWKNHNSWIFNLEKWSELEVVQHAWSAWMEYKNAQKQTTREKVYTIRLPQKEAWKAPGPGVIKLNVSSASKAGAGGVGVGIVARDDQGRMLQTWVVHLRYMSNPVIAELKVVRIALVVSQQNGWRKVEIQGDIQAITACLQQRKETSTGGENYR